MINEPKTLFRNRLKRLTFFFSIEFLVTHYVRYFKVKMITKKHHFACLMHSTYSNWHIEYVYVDVIFASLQICIIRITLNI